MRRFLASSTVALLLAATSLTAQVSAPLDSAFLAGMRWRSIGPANMMGRVTDVEGIPGTRTFFFAAAAGGVWKTSNAGTTFQLIFNERVAALGDIAIAPSDTNVIYVGTGEEDSRNSLSPGYGVYKTVDGGKTWQSVGLEKTQAIARIVIHPTDPNTVWIAALGAIWNSNPERGIYKTTDGGKTWRLVKFVSDKAGFVDLVMDPSNPAVLWASAWERVRGPYFLQSGGPGSGIWKSTDGGETWSQVKGNGLPQSTLGRVGLAIAQSNPKTMYALVEADTLPNPKPAKDAKPQTRPSGLYRSDDAGVNWKKVADPNVRPFYYSQVRVDPRDPERVYWSSTPVNFSPDGGKTVRTTTEGLHVDHHAMWIDPTDPDFMVVGNDGGIGITFDKGGNWLYPNIVPLGQLYNVSYDMSIPYNVCGGLQDNGSWCGPSRRKSGAITNQHWVNVGGGDGFVTAQDPTDPNIIYAESQAGNIGRMDYRTGEQVSLQKPSWRQAYQAWQDSIIAVRGDTTQPETREMRTRLAEFRRRATADSAALELRWNWNTPFFLSPHNPSVVYMGANRVMKSVKRGEAMFAISPDLTYADTMKIRVSTKATGGVTPDITGAETYATIVSLNESPIRPGLLYAGTDDGRVWLTRNDGGAWEELTGRFPGLPKEVYVSRIEPSHFDSATVYLSFDNHRTGDFTPYLYVTSDYGQTFRSIVRNLPNEGPGYVHVIREDPVAANLLYAGTETGVYVSTDRGDSWQKFMTGFPIVPVHDLKIHPRDHELIAATHGRAIWIVDVGPLQQMTDKVMTAQAFLFEPRVAFQLNQFPDEVMGGGADLGHQHFQSNSPPAGAEITYLVAKGAPVGRASIVIQDAIGDTVQTLNGPGAAGLHRVYWNFQGKRPPRAALSPAQARDSARFAQRLDRIIDSLVAAGGSKAGLDSARAQMLSGQAGGGFRGGFGGGGAQQPGIPPFKPRPGEGGPVRAGGGGGGGGGFTGTPMGQIIEGLGGFRALRTAAPFTPGGQAPAAAPGDYRVTVTVGGQTMTQKLRVAKVRATGGLITGELEM